MGDVHDLFACAFGMRFFRKGNGYRYCMIRVNYAGDPYDIRTSDNSLSLSLLNNTAESISYRYDEGEEMGNCTEIQIKDTN